MTEKAFQRLLDLHGADPARWPEPQRRAAERLLARSAAARDALRSAGALAALLDAAEARTRVPDASEIVARATAHPQHRPLRATVRRGATGGGPLGRWIGLPLPYGWMPAGALAACLVLGLALGAVLPPAIAPARAGGATTTEILSLASGGAAAVLGPGLVDDP